MCNKCFKQVSFLTIVSSWSYVFDLLFLPPSLKRLLLILQHVIFQLLKLILFHRLGVTPSRTYMFMIIFWGFRCHCLITIWAWYCCFNACQLRCLTRYCICGSIRRYNYRSLFNNCFFFAWRLAADRDVAYVFGAFTSSIFGSESSVCNASSSKSIVIILDFYDVILAAITSAWCLRIIGMRCNVRYNSCVCLAIWYSMVCFAHSFS